MIYSDSRRGQSLMDILVGVAIGAILIFGAIAAITPALETGSQAQATQTAAWLATGLLSNVQTWANGNWHGVLGIATGTSNRYFLITSSSPYTATSGTETIQVSTSTFWRYFYISDVYRDSSGNIVSSGGTYDPSTKDVTVVYGWTGGTTSTVSEYVTRNQDQVYSQGDWSGGPTSTAGATSSVNFQFASSTSVNYSSPGALSVTGFAGAGLPPGTVVQWTDNNAEMYGTSTFTGVSTTFSGTVLAGDAIIVPVAYGYGTGDLITGCSDTYDATSSYHEATSLQSATHGAGYDIWYATNVAGGSNLTVTCSFSQGNTANLMAIEVGGLVTIDATSTNIVDSGDPTTFTTGTSTTHYNNEFVFGSAIGTDGAGYWTITPGAGFSSLLPPGAAEGGSESEIQVTAGSVAATGTNSPGDDQLNSMVTFTTTNS